MVALLDDCFDMMISFAVFELGCSNVDSFSCTLGIVLPNPRRSNFENHGNPTHSSSQFIVVSLNGTC